MPSYGHNYNISNLICNNLSNFNRSYLLNNVHSRNISNSDKIHYYCYNSEFVI